VPAVPGTATGDSHALSSRRWRAYQALDGGRLSRLVSLSYWLNWAVVLLSAVTIIAYLYL
jgi:hypothetical protein